MDTITPYGVNRFLISHPPLGHDSNISTLELAYSTINPLSSHDPHAAHGGGTNPLDIHFEDTRTREISIHDSRKISYIHTLNVLELNY